MAVAPIFVAVPVPVIYTQKRRLLKLDSSASAEYQGLRLSWNDDQVAFLLWEREESPGARSAFPLNSLISVWNIGASLRRHQKPSGDHIRSRICHKKEPLDRRLRVPCESFLMRYFFIFLCRRSLEDWKIKTEYSPTCTADMTGGWRAPWLV